MGTLERRKSTPNFSRDKPLKVPDKNPISTVSNVSTVRVSAAYLTSPPSPSILTVRRKTTKRNQKERGSLYVGEGF